MRWYGHIQQRDKANIGRRVERMEMERRRQGRPKWRLHYSYHEDTKGSWNL